MYWSKSSLLNVPRVQRLNLINAVSGIKPANLIGTKSNSAIANLAIFSSIVHLSSNPPCLGFILRPDTEIRRHTYENILENGLFTINHIHSNFIEKAHWTSAKFEAEISEFEACHLTEEYCYDFYAPFVKESNLKMGMKYIESIPIKSTDTTLIVGEIQHLIVPDMALDNSGYIDLERLNDVGISGLNSYYALKKISEFPYAKANELPNFR